MTPAGVIVACEAGNIVWPQNPPISCGGIEVEDMDIHICMGVGIKLRDYQLYASFARHTYVSDNIK